MTATFAEAARRLAGASALVLGWRPHEFWRATPAELWAIVPADGPAGGMPLSREDLNALMERERDG